MRKLLAAVLIMSSLFVLTGCDISDSLSGVFESIKTEQTEDSIETESESEDESESLNSEIDTYEVEKVGDFPKPDYPIIFDNALLAEDGENYKVLTYLGEEAINKSYKSVELICNGFYLVSTSDEINSKGLISDSGEELIPCEATIITAVGTIDDKSERYVLVTYVSGTTSNEEDCLVYKGYDWDDNIEYSYLDSFYEDGYEMYTGYTLIYDLEMKQFVNNIKLTNHNSFDIDECGDNLIVKNKDATATVFDASGNSIYSIRKSLFDVKGSYFDDYLNETYYIKNSFGENMYSSREYIDFIADDDELYLIKNNEDNKVLICDSYTYDEISGIAYEWISEVHNGIFKVQLIDGTGDVLVNKDGEELINESNVIQYIENGFWEAEYQILDSCCNVHSNLLDETQLYPAELIYGANDVTGYYLYVFAEAEYSLYLDAVVEGLDTALIKANRDSDGLYGVYELYTGQCLIDHQYEEIQYVDGYIYGLKEGVWDVYKVDKPE